MTGAGLTTSDAGRTWTLTLPAGLTNLAGGYVLKIAADGLTDLAGNSMPAETSTTWFRRSFVPANGLRISYADSAFDADVGAVGVGDDSATDTAKVPLLPGQTATIANYTNYSRGINAVVLDLDGLLGDLSASDFEFRIGNSNTPSTWVLAPAPLGLGTIPGRQGAGISGSNRFTINWANNAIQRTWLQVTVKANLNTGLIDPVVFYWGNAVGDTNTLNTAQTQAIVDLTDVSDARNNQRTGLNPAPINFPFDFNRDRRVDINDVSIARNNQTTGLNALRMISVPSVGGGVGGEGEASPTISSSGQRRNPNVESVDRAFSNYFAVDDNDEDSILR